MKRRAEEKAAADEANRKAAEANKAAANEEFASERLEYAKKLFDRNMGVEARARLEKIIKEYPDTRAAGEAQNLLKKLGD